MTRLSRPSGSPVLLVLFAVLSVQFGGALAVTLLPIVGVSGSVALRLLLAVIVLVIVLLPSVKKKREEVFVEED